MGFTAKAPPWINDTDSGGTAPTNHWDKVEANRQEANAADANSRIAQLEGLSVSSTSIDFLVSLNQAAYDAIPVKDGRTLYVIT